MVVAAVEVVEGEAAVAACASFERRWEGSCGSGVRESGEEYGCCHGEFGDEGRHCSEA